MSNISFLNKFTTLIIAALGFTASLAWNNAFISLFKGPCDAPDAGFFCKANSFGEWFYALFITIFAVVVIYIMSKYI